MNLTKKNPCKFGGFCYLSKKKGVISCSKCQTEYEVKKEKLVAKKKKNESN